MRTRLRGAVVGVVLCVVATAAGFGAGPARGHTCSSLTDPTCMSHDLHDHVCVVRTEDPAAVVCVDGVVAEQYRLMCPSGEVPAEPYGPLCTVL
ncbi:MAG: hypothetical protein KY443_06700 [Actinobacteria bacterium]|nr:hypothetical protein [Actinomycetota bacterium]